MSKVFITEYSRMKLVEGNGLGQMADEESIIATQVIDFSGGATASAALNANTVFVRLNTDAVCSIAYGAAPVAATTDQRWSANQTEYRGVNGGKKYSAIANT